MVSDQRVVIIGAGVLGAAIGWRLSQRGVGVTVFDPTPGGVASPGSFAWLNASFAHHPVYNALRRDSLAEWKELAGRDPSVPVAFNGSVVWDQEQFDLDALLTSQQRLDLPASFVGGSEISELCSSLRHRPDRAPPRAVPTRSETARPDGRPLMLRFVDGTDRCGAGPRHRLVVTSATVQVDCRRLSGSFEQLADCFDLVGFEPFDVDLDHGVAAGVDVDELGVQRQPPIQTDETPQEQAGDGCSKQRWPGRSTEKNDEQPDQQTGYQSGCGTQGHTARRPDHRPTVGTCRVGRRRGRFGHHVDARRLQALVLEVDDELASSLRREWPGRVMRGHEWVRTQNRVRSIMSRTARHWAARRFVTTGTAARSAFRSACARPTCPDRSRA